jgi:ribosomal protein L33
MAKQTARELIVLKNPKTGTLYFTRKNKTNSPDKISLKKFDRATRKVETFTEAKMKLG